MATTYTPQYSTLAGAIVRRGGGEHLDRDVSAGDMGRDARGRPALARGPQRLVSRVVRALLTEQGSWWADTTYGSAVLPGGMLPDDAALAIADVALHEAQTYQAGPLAPDERIAGIVVESVQESGDPRVLEATITIATVGGTRRRATLQL